MIATSDARQSDQISSEEVIALLGLQPLDEEGGYFRSTYRHEQGANLPAKVFGIEAQSMRCAGSCIYFLVTPQSFSALHRLRSDEIYHFYAGDPVDLIQIAEDGSLNSTKLGSKFADGESPQVVVRRGVWQAVGLSTGGSWALLGTTVIPGFEVEDFEMGSRDKMLADFPHLRREILRFTRARGESTHP